MTMSSLMPGELYLVFQDEDYHNVFCVWKHLSDNTYMYMEANIKQSSNVLLYLGDTQSQESITCWNTDLPLPREHWWLAADGSVNEFFCFDQDLVYLGIEHIKS
jgi:hypothetical protein